MLLNLSNPISCRLKKELIGALLLMATAVARWANKHEKFQGKLIWKNEQKSHEKSIWKNITENRKSK